MSQLKLSIFFLFLLTGSDNFAQYTDDLNDSSFIDESNSFISDWKLWGYRPHAWKLNFNFEQLTGTWAEYQDIPFTVPGSVQNALKKQDVIPDWNIGLNSTQLEWIENRHWIIATRLPGKLKGLKNKSILHCKGLDYKGILYVNGKEAGRFNNAFIPWSFNLAPFLKDQDNTLAFVFECPPKHLGQIGYTSMINDFKPRFNYGWDWVPRLVQTGIWDEIELLTSAQHLLRQIQVTTSAEKDIEEGDLTLYLDQRKGLFEGYTYVTLTDSDGNDILKDTIAIEDIYTGKKWENLPIKRWHPNGWGNQELYLLKMVFYDKNGSLLTAKEKKIGFKHVEWLPCKGAAPDSDPWICSVNNKPLFLQGINWTPLLPNFADLKKHDYEKILTTYKKLGVNTIRIWGGGFAEKSWLYELCDEAGIMIWQDFPLSSSGLDNYPPLDSTSVKGFTEIAESYVNRLKGHVSLLMWCGGNELYEKGDTKPVDNSHPLIAALEMTVKKYDPDRRFVPGSPSGPSIYSHPDNFGKGIHWDTHGPWKLPFGKEKTMDEVKGFWRTNDSYFFSEVGVPGAMSPHLIVKYSGEYDPLPASLENPVWRTVNWWNEWDEYLEIANNPGSLDNYVTWSQSRQAEGLETALKLSKDKFPACGGFLIWMGHDCFPCMINTSIIDFEGNLKPAAERLKKIWLDNNQIIYSEE